EIGIERTRDAEAASHLDRPVDADPLLHLDGDDVDRFLDRLLERGRTPKLAVVVLRLPRATVSADRIRYRRIVEPGRRGEAILERGDKDERLERRSRLAPGQYRTVELASEEVVTPDQRLDVPRLGLDRDECALGVLCDLALGRTVLQRLEPVAKCLLGRELHRGIQGR